MKIVVSLFLLILLLSATVVGQTAPRTAGDTTHYGWMDGIRSAVQKHLGRPYVWGASGMKSFDCSGFLWRVLYENGVMVKRTTARKFYMMLPEVPENERWNFGTVVFFDNLKHVGIVDSNEAFFHAQVSRGTNRSPMNSFWKSKIYGFRRLPVPAE